MLRVDLDPGLPGGRWACVRGMTGHDEQALAAGVGVLAATELLDRLLVAQPGTSIQRGDAWRLAICDRDRLLAGIYALHFGDHIESHARCVACNEGIEVGFSLGAFVASLGARQQVAGLSGPDEQGWFRLADAPRFRLPTSADQRAVIGLAPERARIELLRRCLADDESGTNKTPTDLDSATVERIEQAMASAGPILDLPFDIACHACSAPQTLRFDIETFLLRALEHERRYLVREIHYLARGYGWGLNEILDLTRDDRRRFVELIAAERRVGQPGRSGS
jgi:hypothetical protein